MVYTQSDYERERAICEKAQAYAERIMSNETGKRFRNYMTAEEVKHPDYAACNNEMRGRVERFELLRDLPDRFTAYLENGKPDGIGARLAVQVWTGDNLGSAVVQSIGARRGWSCDRQHYGRAWIAGVEYAWQGPGAGMYAHFRKVKQQRKVA